MANDFMNSESESKRSRGRDRNGYRGEPSDEQEEAGEEDTSTEASAEEESEGAESADSDDTDTESSVDAQEDETDSSADSEDAGVEASSEEQEEETDSSADSEDTETEAASGESDEGEESESSEGADMEASSEEQAEGEEEPADEDEQEAATAEATDADGETEASAADEASDAEPADSDDSGVSDSAESGEAAPAAPADRVRSSEIYVGGVHFVDWFNKEFRPQQPQHHPTLKRKVRDKAGNLVERPMDAFPSLISRSGFTTVFASCAELLRASLTFNEFVALFAAIYNETGGTFSPIAERGDLRYFFEPHTKASYNQSPNRKAGDQLRQRGVLTDEGEIARWNQTSPYPSPTDPKLIAAARECDFNKYRGRGLIQVTWYENYVKAVDPLLTSCGYSRCEQLTDARLTEVVFTDSRISRGMVGRYFASRPGTPAALDAMNAATPSFTAFGRLLNGGTYPQLFDWRCQRIVAAAQAAGLRFA